MTAVRYVNSPAAVGPELAEYVRELAAADA